VVESGELMVDSEINLQGGAVVAQLAHNQEVGVQFLPCYQNV
jgi:hypothetical protein